MDPIALRRKVERLKAQNEARGAEYLAHAVVENIARTTPGGYRGSRTGIQVILGAAGTLSSVLGLIALLLLVASAFVRAAP